MHHFSFRDGVLQAENVPVPDMADSVGTPFYCYSSATLTRHYHVFETAFADVPHMICYAMKANSNQAIIATLGRLGAGADVVSGGELQRALRAGIDPAKILFSGVGKTAEEIELGLDSKIHCFNVESEPELVLLASIAEARGVSAPISIRINPHVDAQTHEKISTGRKSDKFGVAWDKAREIYGFAGQLPGVDVIGIDMHIGSQITSLAPFDEAFSRLDGLIRDLRSDGHTIEHVDLGGGLGIPYRDDNDPPPLPIDYADVVKRHVRALDCQVVFEPGRLIVGNAGVLVTRVLFVKESSGKTFIIVDAAMNDLIRPTLYDAYHRIGPVLEPTDTADDVICDVVGPVCETGDFLAKSIRLPKVEAGDLLAIYSAGAYGAVQSTTYNSRLLVPEVLVRDDHYAVIRERPTYDDLINLDTVPSWLTD